ncbi:MAG: tetratricopeptide repeat protein [Isosphaeraceae bacterium]
MYAHNLASQLIDMDKRAEAEPLLREAMEVGGRLFPAGHRIPIGARLNLAKLLNLDERFDETEKLLDEAEPAFRKEAGVQGERNLSLLLTRRGRARTGLKKFDEAEADLLAAYPMAARSRGDSHELTRACAGMLSDLYKRWDEDQPGRGYDAKAAEWREKLAAPKS